MKIVSSILMLCLCTLSSLFAQSPIPAAAEWSKIAQETQLTTITNITYLNDWKANYNPKDKKYSFCTHWLLHLKDGTFRIYNAVDKKIENIYTNVSFSDDYVVLQKGLKKHQLIQDMRQAAFTCYSDQVGQTPAQVLLKLDGQWYAVYQEYDDEKFYGMFPLSDGLFAVDVNLGPYYTFITEKKGKLQIMGVRRLIDAIGPPTLEVIAKLPKNVKVLFDAQKAWGTSGVGVMEYDFVNSYFLTHVKGQVWVYKLYFEPAFVDTQKLKKMALSILTPEDQVIKYMGAGKHLAIIKRKDRMFVYDLESNKIVYDNIKLFTIGESELFAFYTGSELITSSLKYNNKTYYYDVVLEKMAFENIKSMEWDKNKPAILYVIDNDGKKSKIDLYKGSK